MANDYLSSFPIHADLLPGRLRALLAPVGTSPTEMVEVSCREDDEAAREHAYMLMAVVNEESLEELGSFRGVMGQVVAYSTPVIREKGRSRDFSPSVSGHDFIVASWGSGSQYSYNLAEKAWMALGLSPRCFGNNEQRLAYDDLRIPVFGVAEGEVSADFEWASSRDIRWRMRNDYLRDYLWMRGGVGVRSFFYQGLLKDCNAVRALMEGKPHVAWERDWYELDIREHEGGLLLQVWAAVVAVTCERCETPTADGLTWPGIDGPMTKDRANSLVSGNSVYLDDRFLERYEQSLSYNTVPHLQNSRWSCSPSYRGQWAFSDCVRVGRNLVKVQIRELYKPKPDKEILHAYAYAVSPEEAQARGLTGEHIVEKTHRLLLQLLNLGENLSRLGLAAGMEHNAAEWVGLDRAELEYRGWIAYDKLVRLAQVAPLSMTQQSFLARCKSLHELWQKIPDGLLRKLLVAAGVPGKKLEGLRSLKLLQALANVVGAFDEQRESAKAIRGGGEPAGWAERNGQLAPLFLNNELRNADAHDSFGHCMAILESMGFDVATVNVGYGAALDFVFDGVIAAFETLNQPIARLLSR